jgi:hypothetical protein
MRNTRNKSYLQGQCTKILTLRHEINTGRFIGGGRFSDREKVLTQVVRYFIDRFLDLIFIRLP